MLLKSDLMYPQDNTIQSKTNSSSEKESFVMLFGMYLIYVLSKIKKPVTQPDMSGRLITPFS